jgi:hypothetical protein
LKPVGYQCCECSVEACGLPVLQVQCFSLWAASVASAECFQPMATSVASAKCFSLWSTSVASAVYQPVGCQCCECRVFSAYGLPVLLRVQGFSLWAIYQYVTSMSSKCSAVILMTLLGNCDSACVVTVCAISAEAVSELLCNQQLRGLRCYMCDRLVVCVLCLETATSREEGSGVMGERL